MNSQTARNASKTVPNDSETAASATPARPRSGIDSLWFGLLLAFLGGLILNITPCVLPVLSIKVVGFVEQAGEHPGRVLRLGLAFALGVIVWFWIMAAIAGLGSKQLQSQFQNPLQNPSVVMVMAIVIHVMALNLFGVFEIILPGSAAGRLDQVSRGEGYSGAFAKGFVATLLGTACTAPLVGSAFAYALTQPIGVSFLVFTVAGIGMALPYVLLAANPKWLKFVPKPGKWMKTFKQAMGFVLLGTAIWLLWVLRKHVGADGVVLFAGFLTFVALGAWWVGKVNPTAGTAAMARAWVGALAVCVLGWFVTMKWLYDPSHAKTREVVSVVDSSALDSLVAAVRASDWKRIPWVEYQPGLGVALAQRGYTVYVDYTADWCLNCKVNLKTVLESDAVRARMRELNVIPIEADYTANDPDMRKDIEALGKISVPVNIIYPAGRPDQHIVLPEILTWGIVLDALKQAGPSTSGASSVTLKIP